MFNSPLRYPGGKNKLSAFFAKVCIDNNIHGHYVEPYSGGASVALTLLMQNIVEKITINDMDRSIYAFWYSVLRHTDLLCEMIATTEINVDTWRIQKSYQENKDKTSLLKLGFSTLFLNRTNRSGIIKGGIIGGTNQLGNYKIDCRFNKDSLISRINAIAKHKDNIRLFQKDAINLISFIEAEPDKRNTLIYFDPPYYNKGSSLYMNHYKNGNHLEVSERIKRIKNIKWIVSYDNVPEIKRLYQDCYKKEYTFTHTAGTKKTGNELLFFSKNLKLPEMKEWNPVNFKITNTVISTNGFPKVVYKNSPLLNRDIQRSLIF